MNNSGPLSAPTPRDRAARITANPKKYFFKAAVSGDIFLLKQLLDQGTCNWATKDEYGATALHHTAYHGHLNCLKLLLETTTNVDVTDADECTPLHNAAFSGHVSCAEALLARGADLRRGDVDKATAVHKAAHNGHVPMLKLLLSRGADSSLADREGLSPLHCAVFRNAAGAAAALLDASAAVDARDGEGAAPLHISAAEGALACVSLLLARGASPLVTDRQQMLPLHFAAANGQLECLHELLSAVSPQLRDASVAARSQGGNTALHHAAANGSVHCMSVLLRSGAELDAANSRGSTALHVAASKRHVSAVRYLLQKGSAPLRADQSGRTPRDLAAASSRVKALFDAHLSSHAAAIASSSSAATLSSTPPRIAVPNGASSAVSAVLNSPHVEAHHHHSTAEKKEKDKKHKSRKNNAPRTLDAPVSPSAATTASESKHHRRTSSNDTAATRVVPRQSDEGDSSNTGTPTGSHVEAPAPKSPSGRGAITRSNSAPLKEPSALLLASQTTSTPSVSAVSEATSPAAASSQSASAESSSSNVSSASTPDPLSADKRKQSGSLPRKTAYKVDRYGFVLKPKEAETIQKVLDPTTAHEYEAPALEEFDEAIKWAKLIGQYRTKEVSSDALSKMKKRCARGIPERVRGEAWKLLANAHVGRDSQLWASLLPRTSAADDEQIKRDLARTFPEHTLFRDKTGTGQQQLYLVLKAFSVHAPSVGYCQGMGFVAALLLIYLDAEDAFWLLCRLCDERSRYGLAGLFRAGMPELPGRLDTLSKLLEAYVPRVAAHLKALAVEPTMYAPQWFITVFLYNHVPFPVVLRLWDLFFVYGYEIVFFFALTLFKTYEDKLLELQSFEDVYRLLKWDTDALRQHGLVMAPDQLVTATLQCRKKLKSRFIALEKAQRDAAAATGAKEKEKAREGRTSSLTGPYGSSSSDNAK